MDQKTPTTATENREMQEVQTIVEILMTRLQPVNLIKLDEREIISYRLAEIFSTARHLYVGVLPRFVDMAQDDANEVFEAFGEVRMNLLHIKDLIDEFEDAFLNSLGAGLEEKDNTPDPDADPDADAYGDSEDETDDENETPLTPSEN